LINKIKTYPNQWEIPVWIQKGDPFSKNLEDKYLWILLDGPEDPPEKLVHLESGKSINIKAVEKRDESWAVQAKGLTQKGYADNDRFISLEYPVVWGKLAFFLPQGAMNNAWKGDSATLTGPLLRKGGISVRVRTLSHDEGKFLLQVSAEKGFLQLAGSVYNLESETQLLQTALVYGEPVKEKDPPMILRKVFRFPGLPTIKALYAIVLRHRGWVLLPPELWEEEYEESWGGPYFRILSRTKEFLETKFTRLVKKPGGLGLQEAQDLLGVPVNIIEPLALGLVEAGKVLKGEGVFLPVGNPEDFLSPLAKGVLKEVRRKGATATKELSFRTPAQREALPQLSGSGLITSLGDGWYISGEALESIKESLISKGKRSWSTSELREFLEASRSCLMVLLKTMEEKEMLLCEDNLYRVVQ